VDDVRIGDEVTLTVDESCQSMIGVSRRIVSVEEARQSFGDACQSGMLASPFVIAAAGETCSSLRRLWQFRLTASVPTDRRQFRTTDGVSSD
jgi:hypothetical protein